VTCTVLPGYQCTAATRAPHRIMLAEKNRAQTPTFKQQRDEVMIIIK